MRRVLGQVVFVAAIATIVGGCRALHTPNNGQSVCGANASVRFSGYIPKANTDVQIQMALSPTGPWTTVGYAKSGTKANPLDGANYYLFDKSFALSQWTSVAEGGAQLHNYVRARMYVTENVPIPSWHPLTTFDVVPPVGNSPLACGNQRMQEGMTAVEANNACASDDSPNVELFAPPQTTCGGCTNLVVNGNVVIDSPLAAAAYVCTQTINGSLTVTQGAPEIVPLPALTNVSGNVDLDYSFPIQQYGSTYYRRRFIQLPVLTQIGGDAELYARRSSGPKDVPVGLDAVTSVGGDITLTMNDANPNVFDGLVTHDGNITIQGDTANFGELDIGAEYSFANLQQVSGTVTMSDFFSALNFFNTLEVIDGDLIISDLRLHDSFEALETVTGDLHFVAVKQIVSVWTWQVEVEGELGFLGHPLQDAISDFPIGPMQAHSLRIENNSMLASLTGATFQVGSGNIVIAGNPQLPQCQVNAFFASQLAGGWTGVASVSGTINGPCAR